MRKDFKYVYVQFEIEHELIGVGKYDETSAKQFIDVRKVANPYWARTIGPALPL